MLTALISGGVLAATSAASLIANKRAQKRASRAQQALAEQQNQFNVEQIEAQRAYNDPKSQVQRLMSAGISPLGANYTNSSDAAATAADYDAGQPYLQQGASNASVLSSLGNGLSQAAQFAPQALNIDSDTKLTNQKLLSEQLSTQYLNDSLESRLKLDKWQAEHMHMLSDVMLFPAAVSASKYTMAKMEHRFDTFFKRIQNELDAEEASFAFQLEASRLELQRIKMWSELTPLQKQVLNGQLQYCKARAKYDIDGLDLQKKAQVFNFWRDEVYDTASDIMDLVMPIGKIRSLFGKENRSRGFFQDWLAQPHNYNGMSLSH